MSAMASHQRLHCFLNSLFRHKSKKTQSSASLAFVSGLHRWLVDSPYGFSIHRVNNADFFPLDDIILLCVFNLGTKNLSGYVRHPSEQYHLSHDREFMFVTSVTIIPKCLTFSTLGTHLVVFMSVIVHVSHWYQSQNIIREIRWKAKAILTPNIKRFPMVIKLILKHFGIISLLSNINLLFNQVCFGR